MNKPRILVLAATGRTGMPVALQQCSDADGVEDYEKPLVSLRTCCL